MKDFFHPILVRDIFLYLLFCPKVPLFFHIRLQMEVTCWAFLALFKASTAKSQ